MQRRAFLLGTVAAALLAACGADTMTDVASTGSPDDADPSTRPDGADTDSAMVAAAIERLGAHLVASLGASDGNVLVSPWSAAMALALVWPGAKGAAAGELAKALTGSAATSAGAGARVYGEMAGAIDGLSAVSTANAAFAQRSLAFEEAYTTTLRDQLRTPLQPIDFAASEAARATINDWVADHTDDQIRDLLDRGTLDQLTRLVLVNAVHLEASWQTPFVHARTAPAPFRTAEGGMTEVPMMYLTASLPYARLEGLSAVELAYRDAPLSMLVLVPDAVTDPTAVIDRLPEARRALRDTRVDLVMPKVELRTKGSLLAALRTELPVALSDGADYSGISSGARLVVDDVVQEAWMRVDEDGTEAAAATAVGIRTTAMLESEVVTVDRPYALALHHRDLSVPLFLAAVRAP